MILVSILILTNILVYSPDSLDLIFNFRTCYQSISHSNLYIELFHKFPSGPIYIEILTKYKIILLKSRIPKKVFSAHHFKRISGTCESSLLFTTQGKLFQEMKLDIRIFHTLDRQIYFSEYVYMFYPGFSSGIYSLVDILSNFGFYAEIHAFGNTYLQKSRYSQEKALSYLRSIEWTDKEICIITNNIEAVVVRPLYADSQPNGLITQITARGFIDSALVSSVFFTAFNCHSDEENPNESVVLFKEMAETETTIFAEYIEFEDPKTNKYKELTIPGSKWEDINHFEHYPEHLRKVDLTDNLPLKEECCDGSVRLFYISKKGNIFNSREFDIITVETCVKRWKLEYFRQLAACCA